MSGLLSLLSKQEIERVNSFFDNARRRHAAWSVLNEANSDIDYERAPRDWLANQAIDRIRTKSNTGDWLKRVTQRIMQAKGSDGATSALAEVRCYGAMLDAHFDISHIDTEKHKPTADFVVQLDGKPITVEVATKGEDDVQVRRANEIAAGRTPAGVERTLINGTNSSANITISEIHPFGAPNPSKDQDSTQANAISRICSIKSKETQVIEGQGALLWIDFRDLGDWPDMLKNSDTKPLIKWRSDAATSGPFWYAFYGRKGAPIFEEESFGRQSIYRMQHNGRFVGPPEKISRFSAAVICLSRSTVVFENPYCPTPLTHRARTMLTRLPLFDLEHSVMEWNPHQVIESIDRANAAIIDQLNRGAGTMINRFGNPIQSA